ICQNLFGYSGASHSGSGHLVTASLNIAIEARYCLPRISCRFVSAITCLLALGTRRKNPPERTQRKILPLFFAISVASAVSLLLGCGHQVDVTPGHPPGVPLHVRLAFGFRPSRGRPEGVPLRFGAVEKTAIDQHSSRHC